MAEKKKILYIVEAMGGGVFTYIVDLANELVNKYDMYIAYAVRKQTPKNYKDYFDKRIHLIEVKNFGRAIDPVKDIAALFEVKKIAAKIKPDVIHTLYNKDFTVMDGGIIEVDGYRPVQEMMEEVLAEHGHSVSECGVISAEYLQEQSYRAETQRAEAMKEKLAAEKPAPEASISFYVAECAEFPVMGEFHDNLTLEQALEVYDKIPAERMKGIKSIGFSLEDGSIYSGMFDLMVGGEVQAEIVNHIQHYRESPLVQKAISDMKTLLEKRQASKELEERPNTRQSVREALKNRKKAQEQQPHQEQAKPKKAKKKGEMEL